nr:hypothetical protein [uncultured Sphingomonas sp.]
MAKAATAELQTQMLSALQALAPATDALPIVANDNVDLAQEAVGITCGGNAGAVKLKTAAGNDRTIAIATGQTIAIRFRKVYLTGTSATGLTALLNPAVVSTPTPAPAPTPQPTLSLSSAVTKAEGNSGTTSFTWTLTLNRDGSTAAYPFTWGVTGTGGNPANAADFGGTLPSGTGTFAAGETSKTITVLVSGDTAVEPDEAFTLAVTASGLNTVTSTGTISNDDLPTLSLTPTSASIPVSAAAGYQIAAIGNVPAGVTPTLTPNDGRFVIGGSAGTGWVVVVGSAAISAGTVTIAVAASGANGASFAVTITAASAPTFVFPAVQAKLVAGQRAQIAFVGDSGTAGWGAGIQIGTQSGSDAGISPNYLRDKSWPAQLGELLVAAGIPCRSDAYFSSQVNSVVADMMAANPNIQVGAGWVLSQFSLSGTMLNCPSTVSTPTTFTPKKAADSFDIIHSATAGLGVITITDEDGMSVQIDESKNSGAQVVTSTGNGMKRTTVTRPVASTKPITITRTSGGQIFIVAIIPYDSTKPCLELLNMGWPAAKAFGTSGTGHWNIYADPTTMSAATPYNALGALNSDAYIVELGTNDAKAGVAPSDFLAAMTNIASKLKGQAGNNGANVALVKCRTTVGGYASYNMSADLLAVIDTVTANLNLAPVINFNAIQFVTADRYDGTHLAGQGNGKQAVVARQSLIGS